MAGKKPHLSAVASGTRLEPKPEPRSISEALSGSSRDVLGAMRKALARKLDDGDVSSNAIAAAYKELRELDRLIRLADREAAEAAGDAAAGVDEAFDASAI